MTKEDLGQSIRVENVDSKAIIDNNSKGAYRSETPTYLTVLRCDDEFQHKQLFERAATNRLRSCLSCYCAFSGIATCLNLIEPLNTQSKLGNLR